MNERDLRHLFRQIGLQFTLYRDRAECSASGPATFVRRM